MWEWPSVGDLMGLFLAVKTRVLLIFALVCAMTVRGEDQPDPQLILKNVRMAQASQNRTLSGRLRTGGKAVPFRLVLAGSTIRYEFSDPQQALILRMLDRDSRLEEVSGGSSSKVGPAKFDTMVRDTDISYEDLALKFLYWPSAAMAGEQTMLLRKCWKIQVEPGARGTSQYSRAMLWVDKETGALMQAEAFDPAGKLARRFKVISGQKVDGLWILKQMRIEAATAGKSKDRTPTYLEIQGVE
jgi:hypothetical protein